jgi:exopolysaccharide biosynthesis polyprenyl glycosylphosphotransferase
MTAQPDHRTLPPAATAERRRVSLADESCSEESYVRRLRQVDVLVAVVAGVAAYVARFPSSEVLRVGPLLTSVSLPALWVVLLTLTRTYEQRFLHVGPEEFRRVLHAGVALLTFVALVSYSLKAELARAYLLALVMLATGGTAAARYLMRRRLQRERACGEGWMRRVVVAGHDTAVAAVVRELGAARWHGYLVVGACVAEPHGRRSAPFPVYRGLDNIAAAAAETNADAVVVLPCHHLDAVAMRRLSWRLEALGTELLLAPGLGDVARQRTTVHVVGGLPLMHVAHAELSGIRRITKEVFDRSVAALALLLVTPLLVLLVLAIRLESPGPALFTQERVGRDGRRFVLLKLRTMTADAEIRRAGLLGCNEADGVLFKMRADPRVTRLGRMLRRYSLDELPQLWNVVLGHMSLVGPRPPLPSEVEAYEQDVHRRLAVKPGLTGLWQVSGRSDLSWDESVRLDIKYVENWSLLLDVAILLRTVRAVLSGDGAY